MQLDTATEFEQVILIFTNPDRRLIVRTVQEAAHALMKDWPSDDGEEFLSAVKACLDVMTGKLVAESCGTLSSGQLMKPASRLLLIFIDVLFPVKADF